MGRVNAPSRICIIENWNSTQKHVLVICGPSVLGCSQLPELLYSQCLAYSLRAEDPSRSHDFAAPRFLRSTWCKEI
jgi:hypothetical protein